jgi:hypothetical protein
MPEQSCDRIVQAAAVHGIGIQVAHDQEGCRVQAAAPAAIVTDVAFAPRVM